MSFITDLMDKMRINSDEDSYDDEYDYDYEDDEQDIPFSKKNDSRDRDEDVEGSKPRLFGKSKVTPIKRNMEVSLVKPTSIDDSRTVCDYLLEGKAVVLNMEGVHMDVAQRIIDFTSGATYSMDGKIQKISNYIFIVTPSSVDLSGDFKDLVNSSLNMSDMGGIE